MAPASKHSIEFDVWGCRGSHNIIPARSKVGNDTSCYSVLHGETLYVFDAGRGLLVLGYVMSRNSRFRGVRRVHVLVTHAHLDHWEGLKDVDWFWRSRNGLAVTVYASAEAHGAIRQGFAHPSYVPLEVLAKGTVRSLSFRTLQAGEKRRIDGFTLETFPLHHYSGGPRSRNYLDTLGYRLTAPGGPGIAYISDHEPVRRTRALEDGILKGSQLTVYDAHFPEIREHRYGHGSQEHASHMARSHPGTLVLAGHIGPMLSDDEVFATHRRHSKGLPNFRLALEGVRYRWNAAEGRFDRLASTERL
jgi:phosphoribosyl 1,2-cyclic phosphodiesterase